MATPSKCACLLAPDLIPSQAADVCTGMISGLAWHGLMVLCMNAGRQG